MARRRSLATVRIDFLGRVTNVESCAFLLGVANAMSFAEMMEVDGCSHQRQAGQFRHLSSYLLVWSYDHDLCCDERMEEVHVLHAAQAIDCVAIAGLLHHRHVCHLLFALLPLFDSSRSNPRQSLVALDLRAHSDEKTAHQATRNHGTCFAVLGIVPSELCGDHRALIALDPCFLAAHTGGLVVLAVTVALVIAQIVAKATAEVVREVIDLPCSGASFDISTLPTRAPSMDPVTWVSSRDASAGTDLDSGSNL